MTLLRCNPATSHIPVVAVTAYAMTDQVAKGLEIGFDDYLTKPIDFEKAGKLIRSYAVRR